MTGASRQGRVERKTKETEVAITLNLDGTGSSKVRTPIPFFSHMLEAWAKHGLMDLAVEASGDIEVDIHHTVEDVGIVLGQTLREALGDRKGIVRYGTAFVPMDEALIAASVDISGPAVPGLQRPGGLDPRQQLRPGHAPGILPALAFNAEITLHVTMHYGHNLHHITEAVFKAVGRALAEATRINPRIADQITHRRAACEGEPVIAVAVRAAAGERGWPGASTMAGATWARWKRPSDGSGCPRG